MPRRPKLSMDCNLEGGPPVLAAKMRAARAILGWSQTELAQKADITQRAIYCLENGLVQPRDATRIKIEEVFADAGMQFEELGQAGFTMVVSSRVLSKI